MRATFCLVLLLPLAFAAHARAVEPAPVLPEGCEPAVLAWLRPLEMDKPVTRDWLLRDVAIDHSRLQLTLQGPAGRQVHVAIGHAQDSAAGELIGDARLLCPSEAPPDVCAALNQALQIQPRAPPPWLVPPPPMGGKVVLERPEPQFSDRDPTRAARATLLAVWLALALLLLSLGVQRWRVLPRWALLGVPVVTLLGLAVRLWLAPRGLQHELFHAGESLAFLHGTGHFANGEAIPALITAIHGGETALYDTTLVFAVLSVPALAWFTWRLTGHPTVALLAAVLLALLPCHIHFSASEEFGIAGVTLALVSWAAWLDWLATRTLTPMLLTAAAGVLAMQCRPEFVLLPLLHLPLLEGASSRVALRQRALWLVLLIAALASWHIPFDMRARGGFPGFSSLAVQQLVPRLAWLDPQLTVRPMLAWLLLGLAYALREAPRKALWLVGWSVALAVFLLALYVDSDAYAWRMQLLPATLTCVLAAWAVRALPRLGGLPAVALVLTAVLQLAAARHIVAQPSLTELQYRFQRAHVADLPPDAELLAVLSAPMDHVPRLGGLAPGQTRRMRDAADPANLRLPPDNRVYLQTAACWLQWPGETRQPTGLHPVCQAVHDAYRLQPIAEADLPPTHEPPQPWAPRPGPRGYRIGFYRLLAR